MNNLHDELNRHADEPHNVMRRRSAETFDEANMRRLVEAERKREPAPNDGGHALPLVAPGAWVSPDLTRRPADTFERTAANKRAEDAYNTAYAPQLPAEPLPLSTVEQIDLLKGLMERALAKVSDKTNSPEQGTAIAALSSMMLNAICARHQIAKEPK